MSAIDLRTTAVRTSEGFDRETVVMPSVRRWAFKVESVVMQARLTLARAL